MPEMRYEAHRTGRTREVEVSSEPCVVYGPRHEECRHTCRRCGYRWFSAFSLDRDNYCPKCGGIAPAEMQCGFNWEQVYPDEMLYTEEEILASCTPLSDDVEILPEDERSWWDRLRRFFHR